MGRNLGAVILGAMLGGAGAAALLVAPSAEGQPPLQKAKLEYRVVLASAADSRKCAEEMSSIFSNLADEGWEYVGPVAESWQHGPSYLGRPGVFVLFRRPK